MKKTGPLNQAIQKLDFWGVHMKSYRERGTR